MAVKRKKSGRVFRFRKNTVDLDEVLIRNVIEVVKLSVAERYLVPQNVLRNQTKGFKVRVKFGHHGQRGSEDVFDEVADGDVIGKSDVFAGRNEFTVAHQWRHALGQRSAQAKTGAACGEAKLDFVFRLKN